MFFSLHLNLLAKAIPVLCFSPTQPQPNERQRERERERERERRQRTWPEECGLVTVISSFLFFSFLFFSLEEEEDEDEEEDEEEEEEEDEKEREREREREVKHVISFFLFSFFWLSLFLSFSLHCALCTVISSTLYMLFKACAAHSDLLHGVVASLV